VKAATLAPVDTSALTNNDATAFNPTKPTRRLTGWAPKRSFLSRTTTAPNLDSPVAGQCPSPREVSFFEVEAAYLQTLESPPIVNFSRPRTPLSPVFHAVQEPQPTGLCSDSEQLVRPAFRRNISSESSGDGDESETVLDTLEDLIREESQSSASSLYPKGPSSTFSSDSSSIYSSASSTYSSGASVYSSETSLYSLDEDADDYFDPRLLNASQYQQRTRTASKRNEVQDAASRERSTLAKKAAMFKNSRLSPTLPPFKTSLPLWSMACRAVQSSLDCYGPAARSRQGTYTPADTSKDIKAMITDDQLIDDSRLIIVAIRGTQFQCLADWSVNKAANPTKPTGFLDDDENACHFGFLQVARAMVSQIATQLREHPALSEEPSLLFTGHSAGGAVAAMLYSHMLSTTVSSDLTDLTSHFSSINCITFGAPPISLTPLPRRAHNPGVFLAFANEGDPVLRLSNAAYVKSLVKLMTASAPPTVAAAPVVKVVRGSRGTRVIKQTLAAPATPWAELPVWPTPPAPLSNAGDVVLLRDRENGGAEASLVTTEELEDVIFGDLAQHTVDMYMRRVKEAALAAMVGSV
jgi:hypothetical protein